MGRVSRVRPVRSGQRYAGRNDRSRVGGGSAVPRFGAVADWSTDSRPVSPSLQAARERAGLGQPKAVVRDRFYSPLRKLQIALSVATGLPRRELGSYTAWELIALIEYLGQRNG